MSWAYFADLRISLPIAAWERLQSVKPAGTTLAPGWSGLKDEHLEAAFGRPVSGDQTFAEILRWDLYSTRDALQHLETKGTTTSLRIATVLDKSLLDHAQPLAVLFEIARAEKGSGSLRLVNDGTASGEDGVELTLTAGKVKKTRLTDCWTIVEELGGELFASASSCPRRRPQRSRLQRSWLPRRRLRRRPRGRRWQRRGGDDRRVA
jgi:hypothetical protein